MHTLRCYHCYAAIVHCWVIVPQTHKCRTLEQRRQRWHRHSDRMHGEVLVCCRVSERSGGKVARQSLQCGGYIVCASLPVPGPGWAREHLCWWLSALHLLASCQRAICLYKEQIVLSAAVSRRRMKELAVLCAS